SPTVTVTMRDFAFRLSRRSIPAEKVRLVFVNTGSGPHDWVVPGQRRLHTKRLPPRGRQTLVVTLRRGVLHFLCDIPGHARLGMKGVLAVGGAKISPTTAPTRPPMQPIAGDIKLTTIATHLD